MSKFQRYFGTRRATELHDFRPPADTRFTPDEVAEIRGLVSRYGPPRKIAKPEDEPLTGTASKALRLAGDVAFGAFAGLVLGVVVTWFSVTVGIVQGGLNIFTWWPFNTCLGIGALAGAVSYVLSERNARLIWAEWEASAAIRNYCLSRRPIHSTPGPIANAYWAWEETRDAVARIKDTSAWTSGLVDDHHIRVNLDETLTQIGDRVFALVDLYDLRTDGLPKDEHDNLDRLAREAVRDTGVRVDALLRYADEIDALSTEYDRLCELEAVEAGLPKVLDALAASGIDLAEARYLDERAAEIKARREAITGLVGLLSATRTEIEATA